MSPVRRGRRAATSAAASRNHPGGSARIALLIVFCAGLIALALIGRRVSPPVPAAAPRATFAIPAWAYPLPSPAPTPPAPIQQGAASAAAMHHVAGSAAAYTSAQLADLFTVLDWFPKAHPPLPAVVAHGHKPLVFACGSCHLPDGAGRPENATLEALPPGYIVAQLAAFRSGARRAADSSFLPVARMRAIASNLSDSDVARVAAYFSSLPARQRSRVTETTRIPRPIADLGIYFADTSGATELLGDRLIEMGTDREAHEARDPHATYVAYVPPGSIERGRVLATIGRPGVTPACISCHGAELRGVGLVPPIAGRHASYILRQLLAFRTGTRSAREAAPMRTEAATLSLDDMIAAAAYAASHRP